MRCHLTQTADDNAENDPAHSSSVYASSAHSAADTAQTQASSAEATQHYLVPRPVPVAMVVDQLRTAAAAQHRTAAAQPSDAEAVARLGRLWPKSMLLEEEVGRIVECVEERIDSAGIDSVAVNHSLVEAVEASRALGIAPRLARVYLGLDSRVPPARMLVMHDDFCHTGQKTWLHRLADKAVTKGQALVVPPQGDPTGIRQTLRCSCSESRLCPAATVGSAGVYYELDVSLDFATSTLAATSRVKRF